MNEFKEITIDSRDQRYWKSVLPSKVYLFPLFIFGLIRYINIRLI